MSDRIIVDQPSWKNLAEDRKKTFRFLKLVKHSQVEVVQKLTAHYIRKYPADYFQDRINIYAACKKCPELRALRQVR